MKNNISLFRVRQLQKHSGENNVTLCQRPTFPDQSNIIVSKENVVSDYFKVTVMYPLFDNPFL